MSRTLSRSAVLLASTVLIFTNLSSAGTGAQKRKAAAKTDQTPPAVQQLVPLQAPTPEQMPAQPAQVTFNNGLLAINAENSSLADVLLGVRNALKIGLETPPGAGSERVVVHLGPGQPRDVLTQFFSGSKYDYILVGTAQDPQGVSQVILTPRQGTTVAGNASPPPQPAVGGMATNSDDADSADTEDTAQQQPEPTAAPQLPPANPYQPNTPPQQPASAASSGGETGGQQVKTPEQLLQELQRMQQQQQQQQQPNRPQ